MVVTYGHANTRLLLGSCWQDGHSLSCTESHAYERYEGMRGV